MSLAEQKKQLRQTLRQQRRALSSAAQQQASIGLAHVIQPLLRAPRSKRIAMYLANDGEVNLQPLIELCWSRHIDVYLPVLHAYKPKLWFGHYSPETTLVNNRYGIPEPLYCRAIAPWQLNLVLLPLVGFDPNGGRLGMGGGFYDRTFGQQSRWPKAPRLCGIAHECQKLERIPMESWDIPLQAIVTDKAIYEGKSLVLDE